MLRRARRRLRSERGAVIVTFALLLPVALLMASFIVDVGNWYVHKRHLQMQADAGAYAPASLFNACIGGVGGAGAAIEAEARKYAGDPGTTPHFNEQIGAGSRGGITVALNKKTYPVGGAPRGDTAPDDTVEADPCAAAMIDVKISNTDVPWFFRAANVRSINAHARTQILVATGLSGVLPIAFPDPTPKTARVEFFDEDNPSTTLASAPITDTGTRTTSGFPVWDNAAAPMTLAVGTRRHIGVRVILSGSTSTTCGDRLVECYLRDPDTGATIDKGVLLVRGYNPTAARGALTNPPVARDVTTTGAACAWDQYLHTNTAGCTVTVTAVVDQGTLPAADLEVAVFAPGCNNNNGCAMTRAGATNPYTWTANVPVAAASGPNDFRIRWSQRRNGSITGYGTCGNGFGGGNPCVGWFDGTSTVSPALQRSVASNTDSNGPIRAAEILVNGTRLTSYSLPLNSTQSNVVVRVALEGALRIATSVSDPASPLKLVGSQTQAIDCDPGAGTNHQYELANGCSPTYTPNRGEACPAGQPTQWPANPPNVWSCVITQTGSSVGQVQHGLNERVQGDANASTCNSPSNWASYPALPQGDPRIVFVFLTPYGTFSNSGNDAFPVTGFGTFYIRDYGGNPCNDAPNVPNGWIAGNFIRYIDAFPPGGTTGPACNLTSTTDVTPCVAVLTR